uniref:Transposase n=1 Tax=Magnetococcus massalia (strain MO-1) TaxID=451514 RepID=A0A1S7LHT2_MAGMO
MIAGLTLLQSICSLSEDEVVDRWPENPYWQELCGETFFRHDKPLHRSDLSRWRKRIGEEGLEYLLKDTIWLGLETKVVKKSSLERVSVDTTVQPKNIAHPTDSKLLNKSRERLVKLATAYSVELRQSYKRKGKQVVLKAGRYAHAKQFKRMRKQIKSLRTWLGRTVRDIERKLANRPQTMRFFEEELSLAKRLLAQNPKDKNKLYALHEPHVACISKGKAHKRYEFGNKVSVAVTNRETFIVGTQSLSGNPYDGHTLDGALKQVEKLTGKKPKRAYVDKGYGGVSRLVEIQEVA